MKSVKNKACQRCKLRAAKGLARRVPGVLSEDRLRGVRLLWLCERCFLTPWRDEVEAALEEAPDFGA